MSKSKISKENLQLLTDIFNRVEEGKRLVADIAEEDGVDLDDTVAALEEAEEALWEHIEDFVHNPEDYK